MSKTRNIRIEALTRVEGEGALNVRLRDGKIEQLELNIFEPPRFFEALLRGRALEEVPDITARICGICPVAYQMSAVHALETALGVCISPGIRRLRRLLYCGEWIESHSLHIHLLNAPDFLGHESGLSLAKDFPDEVNRGLRLKKHGNQLIEALGGRAIHPVNVAVGGFFRAPRREQLAALIPDFEWGLEAAIEAARWVAGFAFPNFEQAYDFVALVHPDEYAINEGQIASSATGVIAVDDYETTYSEHHLPHSTALHSRRNANGAAYLVGPLARISFSHDRLAPRARRLADELGFGCPVKNVFRSIVARALEVVHAYEEALEILRDYRPPQPPRASYEYRAASGCAATEAPRGLIYHRYGIGADGLVTGAKIVPPTSQNQGQIEEDLRIYLPSVLADDDRQIARNCEDLIRSYDPCISCSTHFLKIKIDREPSFAPLVDRPSAPGRTLVVGIGSDQGDDRFGWLVAKSLPDQAAIGCEVRRAQSPGELLDWLDGVSRLVVCDACRGGGQLGQVRRCLWPCAEIEEQAFRGTHDMNLPAAPAPSGEPRVPSRGSCDLDFRGRALGI